MLHFPFENPPDATLIEIAPDIHWMRLPIPFVLTHVNIYLMRDEDGWLAVDTGCFLPDTRKVWTNLVERLDGPLRRILLTHFHVDHAGTAGWLQREFGCEVLISPSELSALWKSGDQPDQAKRAVYRSHLLRMGCSASEAEEMAEAEWEPARLLSPPPDRTTALIAGRTLKIGRREWRLLTGNGHSPAAIMPWCEEEKLLISGDQILPKISPFIGVSFHNLRSDPLSDYVASLKAAVGNVAPDAFVMPGHGQPFIGALERLGELIVHHENRNGLIMAACREDWHTPRALIPRVFTRNLEGVMGMALAETLAHVNNLIGAGKLQQKLEGGVLRLRATGT
jgi:glyoxylase-like metal-dependent hydrolase (beta-lactamase superfamily II)